MKWISVKDKLPDHYTWVLAINQVSHYIALHTYNNSFRMGNGKINGITHWMPLPNKPPKK